jgi:hypothetical protein
MNARPIRRRSHWHPASFVAVVLWTICSGLVPVPLAAVDALTVGWRSDSLRTTDVWNTLSLDLVVRRKHVNSAGETVGAPAPGASYRLERSIKSGAWKTVITVLAIDRSPVHSLQGLVASPSPLPVSRVEDDEDGTPLRAYDAYGRQLRSFPASSGITEATASLPPRSVGTSWIHAFVATAANKSARQQGFERIFGKAKRVNGMNRYYRSSMDMSQEVLADSSTIVPLQDTLMRQNKLTMRRTFTYAPAYKDAIVRTNSHSETLINPAVDDLAVVDIQFGNIRLSVER